MDECRSALDLTFAALAHATRREMLGVLGRGRVRVTDLAARFDCSLNVASKHILSLERAGLIQREQQGREHWLNLDTRPFSAAAAFVERYRKRWENKLDRLASYLDTMADDEAASPGSHAAARATGAVKAKTAAKPEAAAKGKGKTIAKGKAAAKGHATAKPKAAAKAAAKPHRR
jgi:DNA-binding transcriptional ArsR family regulator